MYMLEEINRILCGILLPLLLLGTGLYFTVKLRFFHILKPGKVVSALKNNTPTSGTSPWKSLCVALAGTLGVGNIVGVAGAIYHGGAGAVFWMWLSALLAMSVKYAEVYLAVLFRQKKNGKYFGGAPYYMENIMKCTFLPIIFAVLCVLNSSLTGNIVQVNAAAGVFSLPNPLLFGILFSLIILFIIAGGGNRIFSWTAKLIPFLSLIYILISMYAVLTNLTYIPQIISDIFTEAFSFRSAGCGICGFFLSSSVRYGITRGIFSNEAGCGTAPAAHASADAKSPHHQGCFGIFEVFADTIVLCTMTAFVILTAVKKHGIIPSEDISFSLSAYSSLSGNVSGFIIGISVILFAFATILSQAYYGTVAIGYITKSSMAIKVYYILFSIAVVIGSVISSGTTWLIADFTVGLMTVINTLVLIHGRKYIELPKNY